ncbi:glycosyltransferase family 4 protein [Peribacillus frigoritolerans]|uniref:glycosyltransferase family 4 protein n=1 Tax=Peribacillus frigoritolerans TaxID=450367 RepID=UPI0021A29B6A|nr:glycosyltransferase family 4 protein [Peribacillus frigoritolerans]MCT1391448.1 glycosyltransferase family 4 protein [Peribacillus frigoritolerans]
MITKILFLTHSSKKGGAEQSLIHLINKLDCEKYKLFLVCPNDTEYLGEIHAPITIIKINLDSIKKYFGFKYVSTVVDLNKIIVNNKIDIIHANGWRSPWYAIPFKFKKKVKTIWHHRDRFNSLFYNFILPFFFDKVICISYFVKSTLSPIHQKRSQVIYNGVNFSVEKFPKKVRDFKEDDKFIIGAFGRIVEWKRFDLIIIACKNFYDLEKKSNWKLVLVGGTDIDGTDKYLEYLKKIVKDNGLENNVEFAGHTNKPLQKMSECDITINFSDREPFGRVIIESLAVKTPVIVADSGGAPEIIRKTHGGLIAKESNINDLANKIQEFYLMKNKKYHFYVESGFEEVTNLFNMEKNSEEVSNLYKSIFNRN